MNWVAMKAFAWVSWKEQKILTAKPAVKARAVNGSMPEVVQLLYFL